MIGNNMVSVNLRCNDTYLNLNDKIIVYLDIINNSYMTIEGIFVRSFFNSNYLKLIEKKCNSDLVINNQLISVGDIEGKGSKTISFELVLYDIPIIEELTLFSMVHYKTNINNEYVISQLRTNTINFSIYNIKLENFNITTDKDVYGRDEKISYAINITNSSSIPVKNILVKDFIPKNTALIDDSLIALDHSEILLQKNEILIMEIKNNSSIKIRFDINITNNFDECSIKNNPILEYSYYRDNNSIAKKYTLKSNISEIMINKGSLYSGDGDFIHKVDKDYAYINDILNHTVTINNLNKPKIKNLYFKNEFNKNLQYIKNTLTINGTPRSYESIDDYIYIQDSAQDEIVITFKTRVIDIPEDGVVHLNSTIQYNLLDDTYNTNKLCDKNRDNSINVYGVVIDTSNNTFNRYQDKETAIIGDVITYTIEIQNIGNLDVVNLVLKEQLIPEVTFIKDSVCIGNENIINVDLNSGIKIEKLNSNEIVVVSYKVKAERFTVADAFTTSTLSYQYTLLNNESATKLVMSRPSFIKIEGADLRLIQKSVDKSFCKIGEILTFKLDITNKGNFQALDVKVKDEYNSCFEFIENSIYVNNKNLTNENIFDGIWIDILNPNEKCEIVYKVKAINIPKLDYASSISNVEYIHLLNDNNSIKKENIQSNNLNIVIINPVIICNDNNSTSENGKILKYSIGNNEIPFKFIIKNNGNVIINKIKFSQSIPDGLNLVSGSLKYKGEVLQDDMLINGINLENLESQEYETINFSLKPMEDNLNENLTIKSSIEYNFFNTISKNFENTKEVLEEELFIINSNLTATKSISNKSLSIGDELTEIITLTNTGNQTIEDLELYLEEYDFLQLIEDSLVVDNVYFNEIPFDFKVNIDKLLSNESKKISVRYKVLNIPNNTIKLVSSKIKGKIKLKNHNVFNDIEVLSNTEEFNIMNNFIKLDQRVSESNLLIDDTFRYFLNIKNMGNTNCKNMILDVNIPSGLSYIKNTLSINGVIQKEINTNNIFIGEIRSNENIKISLMMKVNENIESNKVILKSNIRGAFALNGDISRNEMIFKSEDLELNIQRQSVSLYRYCDVEYIQIGNKVTITSTINNDGNVELENVIFKEIKNPFLQLVEGATKINGKLVNNIDLFKGLALSNIKSGESVFVSCTYEYVSGGIGGTIETQSWVEFMKVNSSSLEEKLVVKSNILDIEKAISIFKQFNINGELMLCMNDPDILEVSNLMVDAAITNYYEIETIKNTSYDNQTLTGRKIMVDGVVIEKVEYVIDSDVGALYFFEKKTNFSVYIVIPYDDDCDMFNLNCKVENIYFKNIGKRKIFRDIDIMIEGF